MPESCPAPVTPLTEVLEDAHNDSEARLRAEYAEYLEVEPTKDSPNMSEQLHGNKPPAVTIQKETPQHRFLVFLFAQGLSQKDVFIQLGGQWDNEKNLPISGTGQFTYQHLGTIRRQGWFQKALIAYMEQCGKDAIQARLETELIPSIDKVVAIRDNVNAPPNVQLAAANSLIDRFLGKPVQHVQKSVERTIQTFEDDADALQREAEKIEAELRNINPALVNN